MGTAGNLLSSILFDQYKRYMDRADMQRANTDQMMSLVRNIGTFINPSVFDEGAFGPALQKYYGKERFEQYRNFAQGDPKSGQLSIMDMLAMTQVAGNRIESALSREHPRLGEGIPTVSPKEVDLLGYQPPEPGLTAAMTQPAADIPTEYLEAGAPTPPGLPDFITRPVPGPSMQLKSLSPAGPTWSFSDARTQAAAVDDLRQAYDWISRTNPNLDPEDAWAKAFDWMEDKYGFLPPGEAMKVVQPEFDAARNRRAYEYTMNGAAALLRENGVEGNTLSEIIENASPAMKNQAFTLIAQGLAMKGLLPNDNPDFRRLVFGDAFMAQDLQKQYLGTLGDVLAKEQGLIQTEPTALPRQRRQVQMETATREGEKIVMNVAPALEILSNLNELLDGMPLTDKNGVPLRDENGNIRYEPPLLPQEGGFKRFWGGLKRYGQAIWQDDPVGQRVASYLAQRKAFLSFIVRTFGEKGMLTEGDIKRIADTLPTMFTTQAVKNRNMNSMHRILANLVARAEGRARAPENEILIRDEAHGLSIVSKTERGAFSDIYTRSTGETLRDEDIDALRPRKVIEYDINGNEITR